MNRSVPYLQNNESFNPLFAKMKERFCADGTIAEKMAVEAGLCKKGYGKKSASECHMTRGNFLPHIKRTKKASCLKKAVFNLKNLGAASMTVLLVSILFLSGASVEGIQESLTATKSIRESTASEVNILSETPDTEIDALYFADESLPELI